MIPMILSTRVLADNNVLNDNIVIVVAIDDKMLSIKALTNDRT